MYEPAALKTAQINYNTWASVEDISESEKAALLAQDKADAEAIEAANRAEAARIAAEAKAEEEKKAEEERLRQEAAAEA